MQPTRPRSTCTAGVTVALVADVRDHGGGCRTGGGTRAGLDVVDRATVLGTSGRLGLRSVELGSLVDGTILTAARLPAMRCSCPAATPSVHLFSQSRGKLAWDAVARPFCRPARRARALGEGLPRRRRPRVGARRRLRVRRRRSRAAGRDASGSRYERPRVTSTRWARRARCGRARDRRRHVRSSTFRTTSRRRISRWPRAKASCPSSTSSATRRRAWRPTRARRRT